MLGKRLDPLDEDISRGLAENPGVWLFQHDLMEDTSSERYQAVQQANQWFQALKSSPVAFVVFLLVTISILTYLRDVDRGTRHVVIKSN